jgi:hypothetical protein
MYSNEVTIYTYIKAAAKVVYYKQIGTVYSIVPCSYGNPRDCRSCIWAAHSVGWSLKE